MQDIRPFQPLYAPNAGGGAGGLVANLTITGSTTAASGALPGNVGGSLNGYCQIQIANTTTAWAFCNFSRTTGELAAATVANGYPVAPGGVAVITVPSEVAAVSVILEVAPGTETKVVFTRGTGS